MYRHNALGAIGQSMIARRQMRSAREQRRLRRPEVRAPKARHEVITNERAVASDGYVGPARTRPTVTRARVREKQLELSQQLSEVDHRIADVAGLIASVPVALACAIDMKDLALACSEGNTRPQRSARRRVATKFYLGHLRERQHSGSRKQVIEGHLAGIDFSKPVVPTQINKGTSLTQWVRAGGHLAVRSLGNYFSIKGSTASGLGIVESGRGAAFIVAPADCIGLKSTAANIVDTWSFPGKAVEVKGGRPQLYSPSLGVALRTATVDEGSLANDMAIRAAMVGVHYVMGHRRLPSASPDKSHWGDALQREVGLEVRHLVRLLGGLQRDAHLSAGPKADTTS